MTYSSIHVHGKYSDGSGELEEFVQYAVKHKMESLGFSSHVPLPIDNVWSMKLEQLNIYVENVLDLKKKYRDKLNIYLGLELDYIKGLDIKKYIDFDSLPLDYFIGAVHYVHINGEYKEVDGNRQEFEELLYNYYDGNIKELYTEYFSTYREMISQYKPKVAAHLDLIKKNNAQGRFFDEQGEEYIDEVNKTLDVVKKSSSIVEVNTGGLSRGYTKEPYPSKYILEKCFERDIDIMLNSDSHSPKMLTFGYDKAIECSKEAGYDAHIILYKGNMVKRPFY